MLATIPIFLLYIHDERMAICKWNGCWCVQAGLVSEDCHASADTPGIPGGRSGTDISIFIFIFIFILLKIDLFIDRSVGLSGE
jgi:hypothetical protein